MPKVRLNYDGWLTLPEAARRTLGVGTGDRLDLEVVGRTVVLRPARGAEADVALPAEETPPPASPQAEAAILEPGSEPAAASAPQDAERRKPGRPRKAAPVAADPAPEPKPKARGRRAAAPAVG